tara:strand:+ start:459 stop:2774 length:2316 start_codon:yes stop_codon:yes gene_type:complete
MSTIKISDLADGTITVSSFIALATSSGAAFKGTVDELQTFINTIAVLGLKSAISAADSAPTEDGLFPCQNTGTYSNFGGLAIDVSNTISFISVSGTQTVFKKVEIPVTTTVENIVQESNTTIPVSGNAVVDYITNASIVNTFNSFNFVGSGSTWNLEVLAGSLNIQLKGLSKNNILISKSIPSGYQYLIFQWSTGDILIQDNSVASESLKTPLEHILIGRVFAQYNLFGMQCNYMINGVQNDFNVPTEYNHFLTNNPSSFLISGSQDDWTLDIPSGSLNMQINETIINNTLTSLTFSGGGYEYLIGNISTGNITIESNKTTVNGLLDNRAVYILIGKLYPKFGLFDLRCNFNVNGVYNILDKNLLSKKRDFLNEVFEDVNHIINYGQSLSVGETEKVISTEALAKYGNLLTFGGSVLTSPYSEDYPGNLTSFSTLFERSYVDTSALKETPTTGTCEKLYSEYLNGTNNNKNIKILGSAPGEGAKTVSQLSKGSSYYTRVMADVTAGLSVSNGLGLSYKVSAVTWTQGESDYVNGTTKAVYKSLLTQLMIDLNTDIKAITSQTEDIRFISYQTASIDTFNTIPEIALAQYELAISDDNILEMALSMYNFEYNDRFHLKAEYSKLLGSYYGKTLSETYSDKKNKPIYPIGHIIKTNNIDLTFNVPVSPLVFETIATTETITNQGFEVIKSSVNILTSISLDANGTNLILVCSESPVGSVVRYGFQKGTRSTTAGTAKFSIGFLRDSAGYYDNITIDGNFNKMDNWCPVLEYSI